MWHLILMALAYAASYYLHAHPLQSLKPLGKLVQAAKDKRAVRDLVDHVQSETAAPTKGQ